MATAQDRQPGSLLLRSAGQLYLNKDVLMSGLLMGTLLLMVMPLPPVVIDFLLCISITLAILILVVTLFMTDPLEFTVFPTLLLFSTLFRLSLNIASTRLILTHGDQGVAAAGRVIETFGNFVVGGNYAVGAVVFVILVIINFSVITKGSGRIAEVAARFTLDALPGKQMSIDAELNSGLINEHEARARRKRVSLEADFYGSMDGASKFIRGDAIAGIFITITNIVGGLFIGVIQKGMNVLEALQVYTVMTIGEGLVSQVPALVISTAAGILVTRVNTDKKLDNELASQLLGSSRSMATVSGIVALFVLVPGLRLPFLTISAVLAASAYFLNRQDKKRPESDAGASKFQQPSAPATREQDKLESLLSVDVLELEVGYDLIPLVDERRNGELLERILRLRKQFASTLGIIVPPIHIKDNLHLAPGDYSVLLKGTEIARGSTRARHLLAIDPGSVSKRISGVATREPAFGLPALWTAERDKDLAIQSGYTVVDLPTMLSTHLSEVIKQNAQEFLGRQELQGILDGIAKTHPKVIDELIPNLLPMGSVLKVLQNLLKEQISVRDIVTILEGLADYAPKIKDPDTLTELIRQKLARQLTRQFGDRENAIHYIGVHSSLEEAILRGISQSEFGPQLALEPATVQNIIKQVNREIELHTKSDLNPVLLCSPAVRGHLRRLLERFCPTIPVLSHNEMANGSRLIRLGIISAKGDA